jgi:parallel beta-helix repeat protein
MELAARSGQTRPYNVYIAVNGHSVGTLSNTFPRGYYEFDIDSSYLNYATAGTAENRYTLDTDIPGSYMTPLSNVRVVLCLDELKLHICAESAEQAYDIAWSAPYIHKPSGSITVNVLSLEEGRPLNLNQPVLIKAEVLGDDGKEKRCTVKATFSCCDEEIPLVDNGLHDDGQAGDGVYANTWIPEIAGSCEITVSASNCASTGYDVTAVTVNTSKPDLTLTQYDIEFKNSFRKVRSNNLYLIEGKLTNITATIHNLGSGDAKDVIVCFYDEHPSSGEVIGSTTIPQLSSRTTENVSISWNPTPVGEHNITVVLDPDNLIPELNETNNNATQNVSVVSSLSINDTILMVDKNPMFDNGSSVINLTSNHEIVAVGSIIQPIVSSNTTLDASIHVKLSDISGNVIWQSLKTGKIYLTVNSSSNDITLFIEPDSIFDIPDNPNYYGIRTLELIAIPSSEVIGVIDINRTIYVSPYDLTTYSESGTYFYRFSGGRTLTGDSPIGIICSPEFEQHFAYDASYNETTTTYDITIPVFVAHEELVGLTELAKKYPNAEVKIIPYTGDLGGMKNTIQWHVQNYRSRGITPLIVGVVPHFHVEYHELKVSKAYKATYMSYAMACNINNEILWDGLDKQALVSDNFRSDEIAKPLIAGENPKYSKDSTQLGSINDYPVVLLCRKDLPLLQIAPTLSTKEVRENGSLQDNYTIYRVGPLVPIGHTYYVGASGSVPLCTISLNPTALSLNFGYGITLPIINQDVGLSFALIGGMQGISGVLKILTFDEVTGSLHDLLYDERTVGICPACVTFKVADYLPFTSLLNSMDEFFQEFFTAFATGLYQPLIVGLNAEDYLEPSNIFTILKTTAGDLGSSPQPVYYSVENVRETYPSSVVGVNLAMSAIAGLSSLAEFGKLFGFTISPTFTGSPEVLHYTGTVNDVNLIMLMDDIKNIEEHPFTYKIPQKDEAEPPSGVVMIEIPAKVFLGMIDLPTKTEIQKRLRATGDLRRNPINKITRAYNSVRGKYPTLGKIKQSAIKKISSALGKKNLLSKKLTIDVLKALNALGKFTATYAEAMDVATFSSQELYYFGDPTTTGYDDPVNVASPKVLPRDFNITVASEPLTLNVLNSTFVFSNVTNIGAPNITMQIITSSYAPATGYPQVPMITLAIQSPVNQVIGSIDVTLQNPSGLQIINLPMTVINTGNETMPGIIAGNMTSWPLQKWLWGSETHDNITYTVVYLFPFEYDMGNHLGTYYETIDVVMKTEFVSITTGTEVKIESYPNIVSIGPDSEVPVALRVYNDYSSTSTVTNITVTAELPQNLIVLSTDGSTYNNSGGSLMINWDIPSLTTDAYGYCKNLHLNVKSTSIITDLMTASINLSVEYTAENDIRQENLIVPIILVPADLVDVEMKSIDVPVKMSVNSTHKLRATVKNSGQKTIAMVPVRLFLNDVIMATETIHYLENGENHILDFDFKPEHVGRYKISVAVVQVPSEVNITNNVMTHECWVGEGIVLFDESHAEIFSIAPNAKYSYSKLASLLEPRGYEAKTLDSMPITKEKLTNCSIFVISAPTKPFDTSEVIAIREFVSNNGSLLLINEWGGDFRQGSNLNEIAENFGIVFKNDLVNDPTNNFHNTPSYALIHEFSRHYITKGVNEFLYPAGCSLIANNFSIARADDDSYTTLPNIPIQALAEEERGRITVLAATNFEGGRVVCIGDGDFCSDLDIDGDGSVNIEEYDNKNLTLNIVTWLAQREINELPVASFSYPPPKLFTNQTITFNASSSYDPDGTIGNYEWEFGDGANGTGEIVTYSYSAAGTYNVTLTVTDDDGATNKETEKIEVVLNATYVPDDYPKIQAAVDAASAGDIIIIRDGIYTENIDVNKRLMIRSENGAATTIVQAGNSNDHVFAVTADYVNLSGFIVEGAVGEYPQYAGIYLEADYCNIANNIILNNYDGLCLRYSLNNRITSNNITDNTRHGIALDWDCNYNTIYGNTISLNGGGLSLDSSSNNEIYNNTINSNRGSGGISFYSASRNNRIYLNNFVNNSKNAIIYYAISNVWNSPGKITYTYNSNTYTKYLGNYWSDYKGYDPNHDGIGDIAYIIYSEKDHYPLIQQWEKYFGVMAS